MYVRIIKFVSERAKNVAKNISLYGVYSPEEIVSVDSNGKNGKVGIL